MDKGFKVVAKVIAYPVLLITATFVLFRGIVGSLWGAHSDFALVGAVGVALLGSLLLLYLAMKAVQNVLNDFNSEKEEN